MSSARPWEGRRLHFIAIGGAGMSGLALVAQALGAEVTGSDRADSSYMERLRAAGLDPHIGHDGDLVPEDAELVVSTAIPEDNPELTRGRERSQRVLHRGELLAEVCALRRLIAVAGTHGKTTTSAMLAHGLAAIGSDTGFILGGELPAAGPNGDPANASWGEGEWLVAEADESDGSFLHLRPEVAVITNIELDHHSRWGSLAELHGAFSEFAGGSRVVVAGRGVEAGGAGEGTVVRFEEGAAAIPEPRLSIPGEHNRSNARAAIAAAAAAGFDGAAFAEALESFPGVARRLERKGVRDGAIVLDDYAHHPTEVRAALEAARELEPKRLIAVFQPHLYSRTRALAPEFGAALTAADEIGVLGVYAAREEPVGELAGVSGLEVAREAARAGRGRPVWWLDDLDTAERLLVPRLREGDVLVTLGAGDVWRLAEALVGNGSG